MAYKHRYSRSGGSASGGWMIVGGLFIIFALFLAGYFIFSYLNWVEVPYEAEDTSCHTEKNLDGSKKNKCLIKYTYTYNGQTYTHYFPNHAPTNGQGGILKINPDNPNKYINEKNNYIIISCIGGLGLVFFLCGFIPAMRRRED